MIRTEMLEALREKERRKGERRKVSLSFLERDIRMLQKSVAKVSDDCSRMLTACDEESLEPMQEALDVSINQAETIIKVIRHDAAKIRRGAS